MKETFPSMPTLRCHRKNLYVARPQRLSVETAQFTSLLDLMNRKFTANNPGRPVPDFEDTLSRFLERYSPSNIKTALSGALDLSDAADPDYDAEDAMDWALYRSAKRFSNRLPTSTGAAHSYSKPR